MKRSGFTMIELIFVIVILGILAAVAIPKLAATRDDAKIAGGATEIATLVSDFGAYYTAQGSFGRVQDMTNVQTDDVTIDMNGTASYTTYDVSGVPCIEINTSETAALDGNFTVGHIAENTSAVCRGIAEAAKKVVGGDANDGGAAVTHSFGGSAVKWN